MKKVISAVTFTSSHLNTLLKMSDAKMPYSLGSTSKFTVDYYLAETPEYSIARSVDGAVGVTWNSSDETPNGFPHTYSYQQWFILPAPLTHLVLAAAKAFKSNE